MSKFRNRYFLVWVVLGVLVLGLLIGILSTFFDRGDTIKTLNLDRLHKPQAQAPHGHVGSVD